MTDNYDSTLDTLRHSRRVDELILQLIAAVQERLHKHDESKMQSPEKEVFDKFTPKLRDLEYGSDEYRDCLRQMKPALDHHYANNRHHPEFHPNGVRGMTLIDLIEAIADWKAAGERNKNGDLGKSLVIQETRFEMSHELYLILRNTAEEMGWI